MSATQFHENTNHKLPYIKWSCLNLRKSKKQKSITSERLNEFNEIFGKLQRYSHANYIITNIWLLEHK